MNHALDASKSNPLEGGATFNLKHRLMRTLWNITWFGLASWIPPFMVGWRRMMHRLSADCVAPTARTYGSATINALASQGGHLCAGTHAIDDSRFQLHAGLITIGARAWLAAEGPLASLGLTAGEGVVVGARGVATGELDPWTVCRGNTTVVLRTRRRTLSTDVR